MIAIRNPVVSLLHSRRGHKTIEERIGRVRMTELCFILLTSAEIEQTLKFFHEQTNFHWSLSSRVSLM